MASEQSMTQAIIQVVAETTKEPIIVVKDIEIPVNTKSQATLMPKHIKQVV